MNKVGQIRMHYHLKKPVVQEKTFWTSRHIFDSSAPIKIFVCFRHHFGFRENRPKVGVIESTIFENTPYR